MPNVETLFFKGLFTKSFWLRIDYGVGSVEVFALDAWYLMIN